MEIEILTLKYNIMNSDQFEGKWKQIKGEFKKKYGDLMKSSQAICLRTFLFNVLILKQSTN